MALRKLTGNRHKKFYRGTDRPIDQPTDRQTDKPGHREVTLVISQKHLPMRVAGHAAGLMDVGE